MNAYGVNPPEHLAVLDGACRNTRQDLVQAYVEEVARFKPACADDEAHTWARKQIAYWAGYFTHTIRLRVEALYGQAHPILGPATAGPAQPVDSLIKGMQMGAMLKKMSEFSWLTRPGPYPEEP